MAIQPHQSYQEDTNSSLLLETLYCEEERLDDEEEDLEGEEDDDSKSSSLSSLFSLEQDLFWEDEELLSLFSKEQKNKIEFQPNSYLSLLRREAVEWILKVNTHYGFTALTAILAVNYLDRFLSSLHFQKDKPWMIQLAAVTCLSLAAKLEEIQVPFLVDLQVEQSKYVFEAKNIQKMELLVLSTLEWRMYPVTPSSFLDYIVRRLGLNSHLHWEFLHSCERFLLSILSDPRILRYLPSTLATATMLHVINQIEPHNPSEYQNQILGVLKIGKERVNECYEMMLELSTDFNTIQENPNKRKWVMICPKQPRVV
ncbi:Cyclin, N-terminal [Dillenia turbinata]|uniref:Cyclin, N-terminal n=1 Tax=Dillenia turbinata TaxID=194707 RepID=A0AAN8ZQP6_9MAGN